MSFAAQTKKELTLIEANPCCEKAELSALIRMNGTVQLSRQRMMLDISTENAAIARRIYTLIKKQYQIHVELLVRKKMRLKKNNVYIVRIPDGVQQLLSDLHIVTEGFQFTPGIESVIVRNACCRRAYLRGAFLAGGSVNNPEGSSYHLEINTIYADHNNEICRLINEFQLNAKTHERKNSYITYIKEAEKITEFLIIIGRSEERRV